MGGNPEITLLGYVRVSRPPLLLLGFLASISLLTWSGNIQDTTKAILIVSAIGIGNWGMNILNEVHDEPVDRVNKAYKPCPSGQVNMDVCRRLGWLLVLISCVLSAMLTSFYGIYVVAFFGLLMSYVYNFLSRDILGNLAMSTAYAVAAFMSLYPKHLLFVLSFFILTLTFNLLTQFQDRSAERTKGVVTAPLQLGDRRTGQVVIILSLVGMFLQIQLLQASYVPMSVFFLVFAVLGSVGTSVISLSDEKKRFQIIENGCRRLGRLLLIVGFGLMLVMK